MLKLNPDFRSDGHNDHEILTWRDNDKNRLMHGAFHGQNRIILSSDKKHVETALDALDAKIEVLKKDSPLAAFPPTDPPPAKPATSIVYLAGQGLSDLRKEQDPASPVVAQTQAGWLSISETDGKIVGKAALQTKDEKSAQQIQAFVDGMKALVTLSASAENADDKAKAAAAALNNLVIQRQAAVLSAELAVSLETLKNLAEAHNIGSPKPVPPTPAKPDLP
jgi:hypothetical protein